MINIYNAYAVYFGSLDFYAKIMHLNHKYADKIFLETKSDSSESIWTLY